MRTTGTVFAHTLSHIVLAHLEGCQRARPLRLYLRRDGQLVTSTHIARIHVLHARRQVHAVNVLVETGSTLLKSAGQSVSRQYAAHPSPWHRSSVPSSSPDASCPSSLALRLHSQAFRRGIVHHTRIPIHNLSLQVPRVYLTEILTHIYGPHVGLIKQG